MITKVRVDQWEQQMITRVRVDQWEQQMITKMVYQWEIQSRMKNQGGNSSMDERNSPSRTATPDEEVVVPIDDVVEPVGRRTRPRDGIIDRVDYTSINKDHIYEQGPRAHMIAVLEALQDGDPILLGLPHEEPLSYTKAMRSPQKNERQNTMR